eukprot:CAMPEP_0204536332 /NCGR_PEP_ID=MMETSP0661-20131031/14392_1 /ASSEMBLY_ACC=CAM_ASM_000606 /TAXON_ID=109239 /ORGANISM="Alexandrium margalefi, Strain AMGDE01CS-322" /LENGTH=300 /DNA_ID=CAMNT_0051542853 /DNA_START=75 /DNA_END=974 /DNA_ORIENTATION=-
MARSRVQSSARAAGDILVLQDLNCRRRGGQGTIHLREHPQGDNPYVHSRALLCVGLDLPRAPGPQLLPALQPPRPEDHHTLGEGQCGDGVVREALVLPVEVEAFPLLRGVGAAGAHAAEHEGPAGKREFGQPHVEAHVDLRQPLREALVCAHRLAVRRDLRVGSAGAHGGEHDLSAAEGAGIQCLEVVNACKHLQPRAVGILGQAREGRGGHGGAARGGDDAAVPRVGEEGGHQRPARRACRAGHEGDPLPVLQSRHRAALLGPARGIRAQREGSQQRERSKQREAAGGDEHACTIARAC